MLQSPAKRASRSRSKWGPVVRGVAGAALAAAFAVPIARKRLDIPPAVTTVALVGGPLSLAVLAPRTNTRDVGLYALQMWGFLNAKDMPHDDPDALRSRLRVDYPVRADMAIGRGELPNVRLQRALEGLGRGNPLDFTLSWTHWLWFFEPHSSLLWIIAKHPDRFPRSARQMAGVFDIGAIFYAALPTAPPWWAAENGRADPRVRRIMVEVGQEHWGRSWDALYGFLGSNPWAAMPSLHFAASLMAAILLTEAGPVEGAIGWAYAGTLGFALVYLGEHYVIDLIAGAALVAAVRWGEPLMEPAAKLVTRGLQRLEAIANGQAALGGLPR
ncbi:MAG: phosphatase PAP2 family protein [Solirubrobacterales bacterium]